MSGDNVIRPILQSLLSVDTDLARRATNRNDPFVATGLARLSNAANQSKLWIVVAGASAAFGGRSGRRAALRGLLSVGLTSAITNGALKPLFPRKRPPVDPADLPSIVRRPRSSSFPSGHAASAAAYATATAMEAPALAAPVAALAAGVAYSRISNGVHYPSDVVVGAAIGAAIAGATTKIWPRVDPKPAAVAKVQSKLVAEPSPTGDGLTLVVNAKAGSSDNDDDLATIREALPAARIVHIEDASTLEDEFARAAADAIALGVLGGDGTVGAGAAAALDAGIPLVVFPGGTLNHFARDLGVDTIADAISAFRDGQLVEVDVATIDGRVFLNTASFGSYSSFVEAREEYEDRIGKWPAVALALAKVLLFAKPVEAELDGTPRKIWMIFIGNCAYDPPGFAPASRQRLDDGQLDLRIVEGTSPNARLRLLAAVATGRLARSKVYTRQLTNELHISTNADTAVLAADGETFDGSGNFVVTKRPTQLRTYAPHRG